MIKIRILIFLVAITGICFLNFCGNNHKEIKILHVSYDPTRELYKDYNNYFEKYWKDKTGQIVSIQQSHGGSGKQARSIIDGLKADVTTLALAYDIDSIAQKSNLLPKNWQEKFPNNSAPYTSTIVFLVKKGNPKKILDWGDLVKTEIKVITPNPKTSGGARWNFLAAWVFAMKKWNDESKAIGFMKQLFTNVPVLDSGARGATTTFIKRGIGDVLIAWENEAILVVNELSKKDFEVIYPSLSILTEPPVAVVTKNAEKNKTIEVSSEYLKGLYSLEGQKIIAKHYFRPIVDTKELRTIWNFKKIELVKTSDYFQDWTQIHEKFFKDGGLFDQIYIPSK